MAGLEVPLSEAKLLGDATLDRPQSWSGRRERNGPELREDGILVVVNRWRRRIERKQTDVRVNSGRGSGDRVHVPSVRK
jgi:hypothetical protein